MNGSPPNTLSHTLNVPTRFPTERREKNRYSMKYLLARSASWTWAPGTVDC